MWYEQKKRELAFRYIKNGTSDPKPSTHLDYIYVYIIYLLYYAYKGKVHKTNVSFGLTYIPHKNEQFSVFSLATVEYCLSIYCRGKSKKKLCTFPKMILTVNPIPHPLLFMAFCPPWLVEEVLSLRQNLGDRGIRDR